MPLPFAPYSSWEFHAASNPELGMRAAIRKWRGSGHGSFAEGEGEARRLLFRGRDPFGDVAARQAFADAAGLVFGLLTAGEPAPPVDVGDVAFDDTEDAA